MPICPVPPYPASTFIKDARIVWTERHGTGDMWPQTWANDGHVYGGAGDNKPSPELLWSPMNLWRATGADPREPAVELVHNLPVSPGRYCKGPLVHRTCGLKPAGLLNLGQTLYMAVENMNYGDGDRPQFNRQHNINGWMVVSRDWGKTWDTDATPQDFFSGRVASCHFLQAGQGDACVLDGYVWAYFPCGLDTDDAWWCCGDRMLLGRVRPASLLERRAWDFFTGLDEKGEPQFNADYGAAAPVFSYPCYCGENHVSYNPHIKRYILGNYAFYNPATGEPRPYHTLPHREYVTQLSCYEAERPWGPWRLFLREDNWLTGGYQPTFPVKWMAQDGKSMALLGSGNNQDYCFVTQGVEYNLAE